MKTTINNQKGFTLIELVVVMVILALLAAVAVPKFMDLQKQAEAASVKKVIGNLRSALSLRVAQALIDGEDLPTLATSMGLTGIMGELLSNKPESYIGTVNSNPPVEPNGIWYDRINDGWVMYKLKNQDIITGGWVNQGTNIIMQVLVVRGGVDRDGDGQNDPVGLELATPDNASYNYTWNY